MVTVAEAVPNHTPLLHSKSKPRTIGTQGGGGLSRPKLDDYQQTRRRATYAPLRRNNSFPGSNSMCGLHEMANVCSTVPGLYECRVCIYILLCRRCPPMWIAARRSAGERIPRTHLGPDPAGAALAPWARSSDGLLQPQGSASHLSRSTLNEPSTRYYQYQ